MVKLVYHEWAIPLSFWYRTRDLHASNTVNNLYPYLLLWRLFLIVDAVVSLFVHNSLPFLLKGNGTVIVAADANFGLVHKKSSGRSSHGFQNDLFIDDSIIASFLSDYSDKTIEKGQVRNFFFTNFDELWVTDICSKGLWLFICCHIQ